MTEEEIKKASIKYMHDEIKGMSIDHGIQCNDIQYAFEAYRDRLIDSDMPYLPDAPAIDKEIDYYDKVEKFIKDELKTQLLNNK